MSSNSTIVAARALSSDWVKEAASRRAISAQDSAADVLEYCAKHMLEVLDVAANEDEELSVVEYALLHDKAASTVRRWCQANLIGCRVEGREYLIRRGEQCPNFVGAKKSA